MSGFKVGDVLLCVANTIDNNNYSYLVTIGQRYIVGKNKDGYVHYGENVFIPYLNNGPTNGYVPTHWFIKAPLKLSEMTQDQISDLLIGVENG